jgi:hypothetical protein
MLGFGRQPAVEELWGLGVAEPNTITAAKDGQVDEVITALVS